MRIKFGITGNYYATSDNKAELQTLCSIIGKSIHSIYYNNKYNVFAIRIKLKKHKTLIKQIQISNIEHQENR